MEYVFLEYAFYLVLWFSFSFPRQTIHYHSNPSLCQSNVKEAKVQWFYEEVQDLPEHTHTHTHTHKKKKKKKRERERDVLFIMGHLNVKVGSQETPVVMGKFDHGVQNEAGQRLTEFFPKRTNQP